MIQRQRESVEVVEAALEVLRRYSVFQTKRVNFANSRKVHEERTHLSLLQLESPLLYPSSPLLLTFRSRFQASLEPINLFHSRFLLLLE